ncbi:MAG: hypothetical protein ACUVQF_05435 [Fervidobacterium sp.]|uniref:hypothetical protein n=1 Tax=Fervidobacterium sp. TaxID=1871331 RepID=UPI00404B9B93
MKKDMKVLLAVLLVCVSLSVFGFEFGGGGPLVMFIPGGTFFDLKNINIPVIDFPNFEDGIIAIGGFGYGGVPGLSYGGGFGFGGEKEVTKDGKKYKLEVSGGFGGMLKNLSFGNVSLQAGAHFGGVDIMLGRKVNENNTNLSNLEDGTLEGYLFANISYLAVALELSLGIKVTNFMELRAGALGIAGYSYDGWLVNNKPLAGLSDEKKFLLMYTIYGGVGFGF